MNKKIIVIAEVTFALIFVVLMALFMSTITSKGNLANTNLINTLETSGGTSLQSYDNGQMKGEAVINAIKNIKTLGEDIKLELVVYTAANTSGKVYGYKEGTGVVIPYSKTANNDKDYINPSADFTSMLIKNSNDVVIAIHFAQLDSKGTEVHKCVTKTTTEGNTETTMTCTDYFGKSSSPGD